jgi:hypothetical protein
MPAALFAAIMTNLTDELAEVRGGENKGTVGGSVSLGPRPIQPLPSPVDNVAKNFPDNPIKYK